MLKNEVGNTYSKLTVISRSGNTKGGQATWNCLCECGNTSIVAGASLRNGNTKSCGCLVSEKCIERSTTHNMSNTKQYACWANMHSRCYNTCSDFYEIYGGRGITICDKWKTFEGFWEDMGPTWKEGLTIERKDFNSNYCPENCEWATENKQARNKGLNSSNTTGVNGVSYCVRDNCFIAKINTSVKVEKSKNFAILKYGENLAFSLACAWRKEQEEALRGTEFEYSKNHGGQHE